LANTRSLNTFRLRGEWYHTDYILFRPFGHREDNRQKNFSILNLFATLASRNDNLEFRVFGKNLTDAQYFGFIASAQAFSLGVPGGPPRTFGAELTLKF
jgi:outer membrane receptor protein involved in Fe transport